MFVCYSATFCQLCFYNKDWIGLDWLPEIRGESEVDPNRQIRGITRQNLTDSEPSTVLNDSLSVHDLIEVQTQLSELSV